eukprot:1208198-Rhodomonas_salina.3
MTPDAGGNMAVIGEDLIDRKHHLDDSEEKNENRGRPPVDVLFLGHQRQRQHETVPPHSSKDTTRRTKRNVHAQMNRGTRQRQRADASTQRRQTLTGAVSSWIASTSSVGLGRATLVGERWPGSAGSSRIPKMTAAMLNRLTRAREAASGNAM